MTVGEGRVSGQWEPFPNSGQLGGTAVRHTFREFGVVMEMEKMGEYRTTDPRAAGTVLIIHSVNISDYRSFYY